MMLVGLRFKTVLKIASIISSKKGFDYFKKPGVRSRKRRGRVNEKTAYPDRRITNEGKKGWDNKCEP
jgi:hypothetical protein